MKKIVSLLLTVVMLAAMLCVFAVPASASSGTNGNINWRIDGTTLTISAVPGTDGKMQDYKNYNYAPWYYVDRKYSYKTITELIIKTGVTRIGKYAFCYFDKVKKLELPSSCKEIAYEAFYKCKELETLSLYGDVGEDAFVYCYKLQKLTIGEGCTSIGREAFSECYALETVTLPASLQKVECEAFEYDTNLKTIIYYGTKEKLSSIVVNDDNEPVFEAINSQNNRTVSYKPSRTVSYIDTNGKTVSLSEKTNPYMHLDGEMTVLKDGWYVVDSQLDFGGTRLLTTGNTNILLLNGCGITTSGGIKVNDNSTLNIYSESLDKDRMGYINVTGAPEYCAGIGTNGLMRLVKNNATVNICGGKITVHGGNNGAGIGSGYLSDACFVNICNGNVIAYGGDSGAGIGSSYAGGCTVTISRGSVEAHGGDLGAGVGSGVNAGCTVVISGGSVEAHGGDFGAGIGSGVNAGCTVVISGGNIEARGGDSGAGIGSGEGFYAGCTVTISGGNIKAHGGDSGAGIGSGWYGGCTITLTGGNIEAHGGANAQSIGHGYKGRCTVEDNRGKTGSILSDGNLWIIVVITVVVLGGVAALVIVKKKKKPALASGTDNTDEE